MLGKIGCGAMVTKSGWVGCGAMVTKSGWVGCGDITYGMVYGWIVLGICYDCSNDGTI